MKEAFDHIHFPTEYQSSRIDCGPACIKIIAEFFGRSYSLQYLSELCGMTDDGASLLGLVRACEQIHMLTFASEGGMHELRNIITLPCIVHWNECHFVVVYRVSKKCVFVSDPAKGLVECVFADFERNWCTREGGKGVFLVVEPVSFSVLETHENLDCFFNNKMTLLGT